ncbi:MAG TPA: biotin transporter BioY [Gemmatimonadaceae bacterium]|nr:biotin transporter BioY [Gemmatimonadaceae bacterium]
MIDLSLSRPRTLPATLVGVAGFALALAAASQVAVPVPGTPVPITLQPLLVVLAGFWLGPVAGAASMALYLAAGAAGAPVFAPLGPSGAARLLSPTGGYLLAYPVAAFASGWLLTRGKTFGARFVAAAAGMALIYLGGAAQLAILFGGPGQALALGVLPFVALDLVKALVAAMLAPRQAPRAFP